STQDLDHQLGIRLNPSTAFHPQTDGQSKIANKAIKQYLPHFIRHHQNELLPNSEFSHDNQDQISTCISPFKENYGFKLSYSRVPSPEQFLPAVKEHLKKLSEVQE
ncbi:uncharacterized protein VP01_13938g1, partial [Puccinia sorghi]